MALSATFVADFESFRDACTKAELSLKSFEGNANKVSGTLNRMGDSFSGVKVVQQATLMASAVAKLGGEAGLAGGFLKLTDDELKRVAVSAGAAAEKLERLGQSQASAEFKRIATEAQAAIKGVSGIAAPTENLLGSVTKLAGAFGLAFTGAAVVSGIKNLIGNVLDSASAIHDQSAALGFSAEAFQRNAFAAEQSGGSLEAFAKAANKLNDNLANGEKSTIAALTKAGLKFDEIRKMKPEDAWAAVTDAVGKIQDPMTRAAAAQDLFGKGALALLPGMIEGYKDLGKAATVMSNDTVDRLEAAQDAWDKFGKSVTIVTGEFLGTVIKDFTNIRNNIGYLIADIEHPFQGLGQKMAAADRDAAHAADVVHDALTKTQGALDRFDVKVLTHTKTLDDGKKKTDVYAESVKALSDVFTGKHLADEVKKMSDAVTKAGGAEHITAFEGEKLTKQLQDMQSQGAKLSPVLLTVISRFETWSTAGIKVQTGLGSLLKLMPDVTKSTEAAASGWLKSEEALGKLLSTVQSIAKIPPVVIPIALGPPPPAGAWDLALKGAKEAFAKIPDIFSAAFTGGGNISGALKAIGVEISSAILKPLENALKTAQKAAVSAGASIATALGNQQGLGTTATTLIGVGTGLAGAALAASAWGTAMAGAGVAGSVALGAATLGIGAAAVGIAVLIKHWHDHKKQVEENTKAIGEFEKQIWATLTPTEAAEAAGRGWAASTIGVRDAYISTGRTAAQADADVRALWDSAKKGAGETQKAIDKINQAFIEVEQQFKAAEQAAPGTLWSASFQRVIAESERLGKNLERITDLMKGQQTTLVSGAVGVTAAAGKAADAYGAFGKAAHDAFEAGDQEKGLKALEAQRKAVIVSQQEFDRLSRIELGAFNTLVASGKDAVSAMGEIGPGIDNLIKSADAFGLSGNAAFDELKRWRELTTDNEALLGQIGSLNDLLVASANLGSLTADGFADLEAQGVSAFDQLTAAGLTSQEAEMAMKPLLESIIKLHQDKGFAIDEATQKIIDQAKADGVLGEQEATTQTTLREGLGTIIELLGGKVPEAWDKFSKAGKEAADKVSGKDGLGKVTDGLSGLDKYLDDGSDEWKVWKKTAIEAQEAVAKAAAEAAGKIDKSFSDLDINIPVNFDVNVPDLPSFAGQDTAGNPWPDWGGGQAKGGDYLVTRPTLFLAGEKGPERATFSGANRTSAPGGASPSNRAVNFHVTVEVDKTVLGRVTVPALAAEIERLGFSR